MASPAALEQYPRRPGLDGHADVKPTEIYTQVMQKDLKMVRRPLDTLWKLTKAARRSNLRT
jgi:hypothetical protein